MSEKTVVAPSLAQLAHQSTTEPLPDYVLRGLGLFELHHERILEPYQGAGRWLVPSGTTPGLSYEVRVGTRLERDKCECTGFARHRHCSHVEAARHAAQLSAVCDGCGMRVWWTDLTEVSEEDGLLSWYEGDVLCQSCLRDGLWA